MIGVCYTYPRLAAPLVLPPGVVSIEHANITGISPPRLDSVSSQTANPTARMLNYEPPNQVKTPLSKWPGLFRAYWPVGSPCYAYGIDASVNNPAHDHEPDRIARALMRPRLASDKGKAEYASFTLDGYIRDGYTTQRTYAPWAKWRSRRLEEVGKITKTRSAFVIEVQWQIGTSNAYGDGLTLHDESTVRMQIRAAGDNDIIIFAGAIPGVREQVDEAVLRAIELARDMKGTP